jgi:hypothetical protein
MYTMESDGFGTWTVFAPDGQTVAALLTEADALLWLSANKDVTLDALERPSREPNSRAWYRVWENGLRTHYRWYTYLELVEKYAGYYDGFEKFLLYGMEKDDTKYDTHHLKVRDNE